ncbi:DNA/RNA non-specific endonuclease [Pseudoalteromonas sp. Z9A5]|uniref:DNA/RNA non-specific endonuclease n=1 Tax=Pseudoalteromonas sp. Z9A5 TaxID=2686355 RepID=UPI001F10254A|nr:DNA/RNA non-specific endonuclease [Pseudoalteromonas sp. Z9A5]
MTYKTDDLGRGVSSSGKLRLNAGGNRFYDDRKIGHQGNTDDIAFHAGADQFGFQGGALNLSPGNKFLNNKEYAAFERELKGHLQQGGSVYADFKTVFNAGNSTVRPDKYVVKYRLDNGEWQKRIFFNKEGG